MRNLQELNLSFNELSSINNLFKNTFLQRLYLHKNKITKIS
ncbi:MAG: leucine-rich repeat domain-containing protein [Patescibacteria group bacterium]